MRISTSIPSDSLNQRLLLTELTFYLSLPSPRRGDSRHELILHACGQRRTSEDLSACSSLCNSENGEDFIHGIRVSSPILTSESAVPNPPELELQHRPPQPAPVLKLFLETLRTLPSTDNSVIKKGTVPPLQASSALFTQQPDCTS